MSYNPNGQGYNGQYPYPQGSYAPPDRYGNFVPSPPTRQPPLNRTSSFDAGDDQRMFSQDNQMPGLQTVNSTYRPSGNSSGQQSDLYLATHSPVIRNNSSGSGGYQHYGSPSLSSTPSTPSSHSAYNPQEYARSQTQYAPQVYSNRTSSYNVRQPYVPAAYHSTNAIQQQAYAYQPQDPLLNSYTNPTSPSYNVPLPSLPYEQPYGQRVAQPQTPPTPFSVSLDSYRHSALPKIPSISPAGQRHSAYTPPAPPPPPFSPSLDAFPSDISTTNPTRAYPQNSSVSPSADSRPSLQRIPSLPHYQGPADYTPAAFGPRLSTSPRPSPLSFPSPNVSLPSTPGPPPPQHSPQRMNTAERHPQQRPLPGPPQTFYDDVDYFDQTNGERHGGNEETYGYEDIMKEVEAAVMGRAPSSTRPSPRLERVNYQAPINEEEEPRPLFSGSSDDIASDKSATHVNGVQFMEQGRDADYLAYSDESDAEAAAGLAALQLAEEQEAADAARRLSGQTAIQRTHDSRQISSGNMQHTELSSDSDVPVDIETYASSFPAGLNYHYGYDSSGDSRSYDASNLHHQDSVGGSTRRSNLSTEVLEYPDDDYFITGDDSIHPFPSFGARVDTGGTGGLSEPSAHPRRLSFEDGDEATLVESEYGGTSGAPSPAGDQLARSSAYPTRTASRPLPQLPGLMTSGYIRQRLSTDQFGRPAYPLRPEEYEQAYTPAGTPVQKSNSIGSHSSTPLVVPPGRSITDAEQRRRQQLMLGARSGSGYDANNGIDASGMSGKLGDILLPTIPAGRRKRFIPSKLSSADFRRCSEPWAISSIHAWISEMAEGEADLKEHAIIDAIVALFTHKVPTMNTADAEVLSSHVVGEMFTSGALIKEEEWVKLGSNPVSGVLFQITGTGCYSPRVHTSTIDGRCYAHHCMRTLKKINLQAQPKEAQADWVDFYKLSREEFEKFPKKEVTRQNVLHEIVQSEDHFMTQLSVLTDLYRTGLAKSPQPVITPKKLESFLKDVFGKVDAVKQANQEYLLAQLKYRQKEKGPWIPGFSDIFREWIRKAKQPYVEYAANLPNAILLMRREAERNVLFRQFLEQVQQNSTSNRLGWDTYIKAPITRLQRYKLLLDTVYAHTIQESAEKSNLQFAIEEIKAVNMECDARVGEMTKRVDLADLQNKLKLRPGMEKVQLNLMHLGREVIFQGNLQRKGTNKVSWLDIHAVLFDHYLVLAKPIQQRDAAGGLKHEVYDVSKLPIPMDLLVLESTNDEPVVKSSVKGIASVSTVTSRVQAPQDSRLGRTTSNQNTHPGPGTLVHTNTNTSNMSSATTDSKDTLVTTTVIDSSNDKIIYPFRVKHLGNTHYVLFATSDQARQDWCDKIIEAKTRHAASLYAQNAEPFRLRVMADTAFAYDSMSGSTKSIVIKGTPLDRAIQEVETAFQGTGQRPPPVCRAQVNCATAFNPPLGKHMVAVGTDYGVYMSEYENPRGWARCIPAPKVTQIAVLEDFSLLLLISDKSLITYHLDSVCPVGGLQNASPESSARRAPQKLSGTRDVGFFATGRIKDRTLVFYKKKEGISSTFKVLEPVYQKSATTSRNRFGIRKGTTEFFRDYDEFYIPSETYAINIFHSSLAIATARGFEVMTLDKKVPITIPDLKGPDVASIAARVRDQKTLGMFRLAEDEFLLVFEEVGIYVNKYGDVSRAVVMEFVGKARQAVLYKGMYLILVDTGSGFVEVRNAVNGRLRQVVSGKDVRLLDDGLNGGTVKISMQHPEVERSQVVLEMIVNEGLKE